MTRSRTIVAGAVVAVGLLAGGGLVVGALRDPEAEETAVAPPGAGPDSAVTGSSAVATWAEAYWSPFNAYLDGESRVGAADPVALDATACMRGRGWTGFHLDGSDVSTVRPLDLASQETWARDGLPEAQHGGREIDAYVSTLTAADQDRFWTDLNSTADDGGCLATAELTVHAVVMPPLPEGEGARLTASIDKALEPNVAAWQTCLAGRTGSRSTYGEFVAGDESLNVEDRVAALECEAELVLEDRQAVESRVVEDLIRRYPEHAAYFGLLDD